jgi:DNA-binding LacI/PurR family transcriptional regulator
MITVKEIAKLAGVSTKTAERALSGVTKDKRKDAKERAQLVRKIAEEHGYRPSELALALRRGSINTIGFIVDILTDQFLSAAAETMMDEAAKYKYKIALQVVRFDKTQTEEAIKSLLATGVNGIITSCCSEQLPPVLTHTLEKQKYPIFSLCGQSNYNFSSMASDYSCALEEAIVALVNKGHKKITFCLFAGKDIDNKKNEDLFIACCKKYNVIPDFRINKNLQDAILLAEEKVPALILYGKYSMRVFQDRCAKLNFTPDVIGIYNEWTLAGALNFPLFGIILEQADTPVRTAVQQVIKQIRGEEVCHYSLSAKFLTKDEMLSLKIPNLTNQRLFDFH